MRKLEDIIVELKYIKNPKTGFIYDGSEIESRINQLIELNKDGKSIDSKIDKWVSENRCTLADLVDAAETALENQTRKENRKLVSFKTLEERNLYMETHNTGRSWSDKDGWNLYDYGN